jgi:hypothetical protein
MIVTAHIKFSIGTTFLDNFFTAEDERKEGESIEDGVLRVRSHLVKAVEILKKETLSKTPVSEWMAPTPPPENWQIQKDDPSDTLSLIQNAPDMTALASFKLPAGKNPDLYKAYCERLKYLSA